MLMTKTVPAEFKVLASDESPGTYEAIVSVFGNVDSQGDRVIRGAFAENLAEWREKGDPIPVIWSHQWGDPFSIIGTTVDIAEKAEGLWVKGQLDLDTNDLARQIYRLMKDRRIHQFSFAYEVIEDDWVKAETEEGKEDETGLWGDGVRELRKLRMFEHGPCLVGANQSTDLLTVKAGDKQGRAISAASADRLMQAIGLFQDGMSIIEDLVAGKTGEPKTADPPADDDDRDEGADKEPDLKARSDLPLLKELIEHGLYEAEALR
jgi:HK97 family phage prohead protease